MTDAPQTARRRAARPAGPTGDAEPIKVSLGKDVVRSKPEPTQSDSRRAGNGRAVFRAAAVLAVVLVAALSVAVVVMARAEHRDDAAANRDQRFVDTAAQAVTNMMTYTPDTIDQNVDRFVNLTSGPLRGTFNKDNTSNLKALYRDTGNSSEVAIKSASLENVDAVNRKASVLVSARVTLSKSDTGVNMPSKAYRMRLVIAEDEAGNMTAYDLRWPDGGS